MGYVLQDLQLRADTVNTRQLHHFLAVIDTGSLSAAAEAVHLSLPALSRSIKALEDELRVTLFDRTSRRLCPTPYALEYLDRARRIVFDEREGSRALGLMKSGEYGPLAFGMGSSIAIDLLAPLIQQLLSQGPTLRIHAQVESSDILMEALRREKLDFIIGDINLAAHSEELIAEPLYKCSYGWFAGKNHPLANSKNLGISQLEQYPIVGSGFISTALSYSMAQLYKWQLPLDKHFSASINNLETVHKLVASSHMIAPSTFVAMLHPLRSGDVVCLDVTPALELDMTLGIIKLAFRTLAPSADTAFEIIRQYFAGIENEINAYL